MNIIKKYLIKKYDLIERKNAMWYVTFDNEKMKTALDILRKRIIKINKCPKIKQHLKDELTNNIDEVILVAQYISSNHILKLKEIKQLTEEQFQELESKKDNEPN